MAKASSTRTRKKKSESKVGQQAPQTIVLRLHGGKSLEEAEENLAKSVPGWEHLDRNQKRELAEIALAQRKIREPVRVTLTRKADGGMSIGFDEKCEVLSLLKLQKTFGAVSMDPVNARANELLNYLGSVGADNEGRYNAALSFIESMEPQNQAEALLLVQMYATHDAAIRSLSQLGQAQWIDNIRMFGNLGAKLLSAYRSQFETLNKTRRGGEQVIRHVHVDNRGGQAVFAENLRSGGHDEKPDKQSHATEATSESTAMLGQDTQGNGVPIPGGEGPEKVPDARRDQSGCA